MLRLWPRSLAARTAVVLLAGLAVVQVAGLTIHALDRIDVQHLAQARDVAVRVVGIYRAVMMSRTRTARGRAGRGHRQDFVAELSPNPPADELPDVLPVRQRLLRVNLNVVSLLGVPRWRELRILGGPGQASGDRRPAPAGRPVAECFGGRRAGAALAFADLPGGLPADDRRRGRADAVGGASPDRARAHARRWRPRRWAAT